MQLRARGWAVGESGAERRYRVRVSRITGDRASLRGLFHFSDEWPHRRAQSYNNRADNTRQQ